MRPTGTAPSDAGPDPRVAEIIAIVARETGIAPERLVPEARIDELGIASIDLIQAVFEIEMRFDVEIPVVADSPGAEFDTLGTLVSHVLATLDAQPVATPPPEAAA